MTAKSTVSKGAKPASAKTASKTVAKKASSKLASKPASDSGQSLALWKISLFWLVTVVLLLWFLSSVSGILLPFVLGILMAYMLDPVVDALENRKWRRDIATATVLFVAFMAGIVALLLVIPPAFSQLKHAIASLPNLYESLVAFVEQGYRQVINAVGLADSESVKEQINSAITNKSDQLALLGGTLIETILASGLGIVNLAVLLVGTPIVAFYMLRDWDKMKAHLDDLLPRRYQGDIHQLLQDSDMAISGFIRGQLNICLILASYYVISLSIAGLPYAILIGIVAGALAIIPYIGTVVGIGIGVLVAWVHTGDLVYSGIILGIFLLAQFVEGNFLSPRIIGDKVGLHPVWVIFGMMAGGALMGLTGVIIAVPVTAVIGVLVRFAAIRYRQSPFYCESSR